MGSLSEIFKKRKIQIIQDFVDGMDTMDMAKKYGFKHERTVYYHLEGKLTDEQKIQRKANRAAARAK